MAGYFFPGSIPAGGITQPSMVRPRLFTKSSFCSAEYSYSSKMPVLKSVRRVSSPSGPI